MCDSSITIETVAKAEAGKMTMGTAMANSDVNYQTGAVHMEH